MSRTSAALVHDLLCGSVVPTLTPFEVASMVVEPMHLYQVHSSPAELTGLFSDRTAIRVQLNSHNHLHSWTNVNNDESSISFTCDCNSFCVVRYQKPIISLEALGDNMIEGASTLLNYLGNAYNGDSRTVTINERTTKRLKLEILSQFGWICRDTCWEPPASPEGPLYMRAIDELRLIMAQHAQQAQVMTADLYKFYGVEHLPYTRSKPQAFLGCSAEDNEHTVYEQYLNQIRLDPEHTPFYLEALQNIAEYSQSEFLQTRYMEQESLGVVSLSGIHSAYEELGLSMDDQVDESVIFDIFMHDPKRLAPALLKIANYTNSRLLGRLYGAVKMDYAQAKKVLSVDENSPDDLVASRATGLCSSSDVTLRLEGQYSLLQIASARKSPALLDMYETTFPQDPPVQDPYEFIGVGRMMEDGDIVTAFEIIAQEEPPECQLELRRHLRAIAEHRNSEKLKLYLETGRLEINAEEMLYPVGLWNIGNTCYLNSLLQFYNTVIPFRKAIENLNAQLDDASIKKKKIGGRLVPFAEVARSQKFLEALSKLFIEMSTTTDRFVTPSEELAYMALVPPREDIEEEEQREEEDKEKDTSTHTGYTLDAVAEDAPPIETVPNGQEEVIAPGPEEPESEHLTPTQLTEDSKSAATNGIELSNSSLQQTSKSEAGEQGRDDEIDAEEQMPGLTIDPDSPSLYEPARDTRADAEAQYRQKLHQALERQQDVTECIENVLYQVEAGVKANGYDDDGEQQDLIKDLFYGKVVQTLQNEDGSDKRIKHELISSIMVNVADGPQDIYAALDGYFGAEKIALSEGEFERTVALSKLPPILQLQVQRVQFNRQTYELFKNNSALILEQTLYMDRYEQTEDPVILQKRSERVRLQRRKKSLEDKLQQLQAKQENQLTRKENLSVCADWIEAYLKDKEQDAALLSAMESIREVADTIGQEAEAAISELNDINDILGSQFNEYRKHGYRLHSLFIHRGQASHGHYWIYIKDFKRNCFLKYNDETISVAEESEVFDYSPGNTATPYFLVYIREDFIDQVQSVNRSPIMPESTAAAMPIELVDPAKNVLSRNPFDPPGNSADNPIDLRSNSPE